MHRFSKTVIAIFGLTIGLGFILLSNPPHTPCASQLEQLKSKYTPAFILDTSSRYQKTTGFRRAFLYCKEANSPGGCFTLFHSVERLLSELTAVQANCFEHVSGISEFRDPMWSTATLLAESAWKNRSNREPYAWLDRSHLSLFCKIKNHLIRLNGQTRWDNFREEILKTLPGTENVQRAEIWRKSIFAINCQRI